MSIDIKQKASPIHDKYVSKYYFNTIIMTGEALLWISFSVLNIALLLLHLNYELKNNTVYTAYVRAV